MAMTEVAQPKLFTRRESERTHLHPEYICDVLFNPAMDEPLMTKEKRMYEKVSALGGPLVPTDSDHSRRGQGLQRSPDVVGHSDNVTNIWEQEDTDKDDERVASKDGGSDAGDPRLYEAPPRSLDDADDLGYDLDRFVENEFQFLDSDNDDDDKGEGRRLENEVPLNGTLKNQPVETRDQSLFPSSSLPPLTNPPTSESDEVALPNHEASIETSLDASLPQESLVVDEAALSDLEAPVVPAPPPLPPAGVLFAMNAKSASKLTEVDEGPKTLHGPGTMDVASNVPNNARPKNEPQSPQNDLFLELQGILNRRLKKINEDIEGIREADILTAAAAATATSVKPRPEPLNQETEERLTQRTVINENCYPNSFRQEASRTEETEVAEEINSANSYSSRANTEKITSDSPVLVLQGSSVDLFQDSASVEPSANDSFVCVLPNALDGAETLVREETRSSDKDLDCHSLTDVPSHATYAPSQVQDLESQSLANIQANHPEVEEKDPDDETVVMLFADADRENEPMQHPETNAVYQPPMTSPVAVPDAATSSNPQSANGRDSQHFLSSHNHLETNPVLKKAGQLTRSSSSAAVHDWAKPSRDDWTPQMDLQDDEFEDDDPHEITSRAIHLRRRETVNQQRLQKKTPSKLYQKKPLRDQQRLANPGAFSLARINRAVKRVFGSISSKQSKQRSPLSSGVFLQEDGWEIYPARPYDQLTPSEKVKVVSVETRPAYAYNAFTRQLVILPDHDRILVTNDGRRIRDQNQQPTVKTGPSSPRTGSSSSNSETGKGEKSRFSSKSKASRQHPPNLNTKTVKSIHMHQRSDSVAEDAQTAASDTYWRRNSSPNPAERGDSVPSVTATKRKTSTLTQILSFRKSAGKKSSDVRMTASDMDLVKNGAVRPAHLRQV